MDTMQAAVTVHQGAALEEAVPQPVQEPRLEVGIRTELKPERVEERVLAVAEAAPSKGFFLDLAVHPPQPVTLALAEPKVTIQLHGQAVTPGTNPAEAG